MNLAMIEMEMQDGVTRFRGGVNEVVSICLSQGPCVKCRV